MRYAEELAEDFWKANPNTSATISYQTTPVYNANETIPRGSIVDIKSSDNTLNTEVVIINSAEGLEIDYASGTPISSTSQSVQSKSYNLNTQRLGRELMTPSELATMPGDKCILQLRGLPPFFSPKYDLKQHPNYKYTAEADRVKNVFDLDKLINRRRRPGLNEACEVYEVDVSDTGPVSEDEDILNYDDVDDPDAYV